MKVGARGPPAPRKDGLGASYLSDAGRYTIVRLSGSALLLRHGFSRPAKTRREAPSLLPQALGAAPQERSRVAPDLRTVTSARPPRRFPLILIRPRPTLETGKPCSQEQGFFVAPVVRSLRRPTLAICDPPPRPSLTAPLFQRGPTELGKGPLQAANS